MVVLRGCFFLWHRAFYDITIGNGFDASRFCFNFLHALGAGVHVHRGAPLAGVGSTGDASSFPQLQLQ